MRPEREPEDAKNEPDPAARTTPTAALRPGDDFPASKVRYDLPDVGRPALDFWVGDGGRGLVGNVAVPGGLFFVRVRSKAYG